jgi:hypothetical protein
LIVDLGSAARIAGSDESGETSERRNVWFLPHGFTDAGDFARLLASAVDSDSVIERPGT